MTIATLFLALIATPAAAGPGEPLLLDFHASWCGPCRDMRPAVQQLTRLGYPVKSIDIDRSNDIRDRYQVEQVPTFIVVDGAGKELSRTSGMQPPRELAAFYNEAVSRIAARPVAVAEAPEGPVPSEPIEEASPARPSEPDEAPAASPANPRPWETVVRIKMHVSNNALIFGSGTIIYSTADEAIILTCAHIFKVDGPRQMAPSQYNRRIAVDLFDGQLHGGQTLHCAQRDIPGETIDYDFTHDVGLIRIRPGRRLPASRVVPPQWQAQARMKMYTVGCSNGKDATAWDTQILNPRVNMSNLETRQPFTAIKCAHQPKEGRSGGGLYTSDGYVAGVCDFADPSEHTGLYATPDAIHALLDKNKLMALYQPVGDKSDRLLAANAPRRGRSSGTSVRAQSPSEAEPAQTDLVTLPPPPLAGVKMPRGEPGGWNPPASAPAARVASNSNTTNRRSKPGQRIIEDDPGVPARAAMTTDISVEPTEEDRLLDDVNSRPKRPGPTPARPATPGKWTRSTRALPNL